jgi:P27 family predicted phage terminase small subunit
VGRALVTQAAIPDCPEELSDAAKDEWQRIAQELYDMGLLSRVDRAALATYCQAWGTWIEAQASLRQYGTVIRSPNGFPMPSPYLAIANKAFEQLKAMLVEFGMSPSSRTRVEAIPPVPQLNPLEELRRRRERAS